MNNRARSCIVDAYSDHQIGPVSIKRLDKDLPLPQRAHRGDAGVDLYATENIQIQPGHRALVGTGVALALPLETVGLIHPRSGRALKEGLSIVNAPGTIDADYRGEIKVCLINLDPQTPISIERGQRIAQLVIQKVELVDFIEVEELDDTVRGASGYGSTGVN
nr:dUTP diphosphatase [Corynebacterium ulcerans]